MRRFQAAPVRLEMKNAHTEVQAFSWKSFFPVITSNMLMQHEGSNRVERTYGEQSVHSNKYTCHRQDPEVHPSPFSPGLIANNRGKPITRL